MTELGQSATIAQFHELAWAEKTAENSFCETEPDKTYLKYCWFISVELDMVGKSPTASGVVLLSKAPSSGNAVNNLSQLIQVDS